MSEQRDTAIKEPQNQPGRERAHESQRSIVIAVLVIVGDFFGLLLFIQPGTVKQRQALALVLAISTGGIAAFVGFYLTGQQLRSTIDLEEACAREAALRACLEKPGRLLTGYKWDTKDQAGGNWTGDLTATVTCNTNKASGFIDG